MKKKMSRFYYRTMQVTLLGTTTLSLLLFQSLAFADSTGSTNSASVTVTATTAPQQVLTDQMRLRIAAGEIAAPETMSVDYSKVKFTKEQAVAKVKELFPVLKDAEPTTIELGNSHTYPAPAYQMIWYIQWNYQNGNSSYGFSSEVDAITGDLLQTSIPTFNDLGNEAYYPPKLTRAEVLVKAKAFIAKAAATIAIKDLKEEENYSKLNEAPLFGPVQYTFYFNLAKNGIYSQINSLTLTMDGEGNVLQFFQSSNQLEYPSSTPVLSQTDAEQKFTDYFDVMLNYIPIYKNGVVTEWILGWKPVNTGLSAIDALTGKAINYEGTNVSATITYSDVPTTAETFKARTESNPLTAEEAAKLVEQSTQITKGHTLIGQSLSNYYRDPERQIWNLNWGDKDQFLNQGFPNQSTAEVDAMTGEILRFQLNQFEPYTVQQESTVSSGATKLTKEASLQKAIELVNKWYPNASGELKLVNHGESSGVSADGTQYSYEFARFYQETLVSENIVAITLDSYGQLQSYQAYREADFQKIVKTRTIKVKKEVALEAYRKQYKLRLQYAQFGGYSAKQNTTPEIRLVYSPQFIDITRSNKAIDAQSGEWVPIYEELPQQQVAIVAPSDLTGHWAEKALRTLVDHGVLTPDEAGKVKPNETIKVGDWFSMMAKSMTPYYVSNYSNYSGNELKPVAGVDKESVYYSAVS
ncbi:MAG: hypothetical protein K6T85_19505, partial [Gorillibacterium sp.]|nr:hypothetical protein [Gorillibacterium sp.]